MPRPSRSRNRAAGNVDDKLNQTALKTDDIMGASSSVDVALLTTEQKDQARRTAWETVRGDRSKVEASFADAQRLSRQYISPSSRQTPESSDDVIGKVKLGWRETTECQTRVVGIHTYKHGSTIWQEFHGAFEHVQDPGTFYVMDEEIHTALMAELSTMEMTKGSDPIQALETAWERTVMDQSRISITYDDPSGSYVGRKPKWRTSDHSCLNGGYRWWKLPHGFETYDDLRKWEDGEEIASDTDEKGEFDMEGTLETLHMDADLTAPDMRLHEESSENRDKRHKEIDDALTEGVDKSALPKVNV